MECIMTASKELEILFRDARRQVDSWDAWQRSVDPYSATVNAVSCCTTEAIEDHQAKTLQDAA
jgi:hypothetical protein